MSGASAQAMTWRCFHCNEVFTDVAEAQVHFGSDQYSTPACQLTALEGGLVRFLREQEEELRRYRSEDTASYREFYALGAEHSVKLRREEERGYAKGHEDAELVAAEIMRKHTEAIRSALSDLAPVESIENIRSKQDRQVSVSRVALERLLTAVHAMNADVMAMPSPTKKVA